MRFPTLITVFLAAKISAAAWQDNLDSLLVAVSQDRQDTLIESIAAAKPDWQDVIQRIEAITFPVVETGKPAEGEITGIDGVTRPWVIYVPTSYDPKIPTPLMLTLHGGVSSPKIMEDPVGWASKTPFKELAERRGWLMLFPFGQAGATWWDEVGITNIQSLVRNAKQKYNVDDDRVYLGGFSDGGSAAFLFGMALPSDYAAFVALNGHMGVGSEDGNLPTYATNFYNSPVYAVTTDRDQLYPSSEMQQIIEMARDAGANILYRQLEGDHSLSYAPDEFPQIADFLERHPRDPFPMRINWETASGRFGVCRWFAIDKVTINDPADWYKDYNSALIDSTISIGFMPDDDTTSPGVKVAGLVDGDFLARRAGLKAGDIIVQVKGFTIQSMDDLIRAKGTIRRGDMVTMAVMRENKRLPLKGQMPAPRNYNLFKREQPSASARLTFSGNKVDIKASRLGSFRIFIHPEMVNLNQKLVVNANGKMVFDKMVKPDLRYLLRDFLNNRDRKVIYINEVKIDL